MADNYFHGFGDGVDHAQQNQDMEDLLTTEGRFREHKEYVPQTKFGKALASLRKCPTCGWLYDIEKTMVCGLCGDRLNGTD